MTKHNAMLGWDVGGAHLKAALVDSDGYVLQVIQVACPLWLGLHELNIAIDKVLDRLSHVPEQHAITMTGELADIFPDRHSGVMEIVNVMNTHLHYVPCFYGGSVGLIDSADTALYLKEIASANWLASAAYVASQMEQGLLVDIGSTTSDFILLSGGKPRNRGNTDAERMQYEELVYTGVVRTPLMSLGSRVPFAGEWQVLAAEHFATTADVYRLTGELIESEDMVPPADAAGKTAHDSARRLARMIGRDLKDAPHRAWVELAHGFRHLQLTALKNAAMRNLSRNLIDTEAPLIGAGTGSFLVAELARQLGRDYIDIGTLIKAHNDQTRRWASVCLPAYAVAHMLVKEAS